MTSRLATILLVGLVGLAPLWLGSNRPLPWAFNAILAGVLAVCTAFAVLHETRRHHLRFDLIVAPLVLWALALGWAVFQLLPLGPDSGLVHPAWLVARDAVSAAPSASISINRDDTLQSLMRLLTYAEVFIATFALARSAERAQLLCRAFLAAACVYALYGLLAFAAASNKILWFDEPYARVLTATFVNRNSAATYFAIGTVVALAFLQRSLRHRMLEADGAATANAAVARLLTGLAGRAGFEAAAFVLLLTATLLTQSRAGVMAALLGIAMVLLLQWFRKLRHGTGFGATLSVLAIGLVCLGVLEASGARVLGRIVTTGAAAEDERFRVAADTLTAISDHALMGSGLGTFQDIFPLYRDQTATSHAIWDKAHNDYLEALLGLGIPAGTALILGIAVPVLVAMRGAFSRRRNSHLPSLGAAVGVLTGFHALFDFSLQIQAVALTVAMLLGVAVAQSISDRRA